MSQIKKLFIPLLKIGVAVVIIYVMVEKDFFNPQELLSVLSLRDAVICLLLVLLGVFLSAFRWLILLRGQGFELSMRKVFSLQLIGLFFNFVVPGGVGGDLVKGYYLVKENEQRKFLAATSIIMDRVIGLWTIIILVMASGPLIGKDILENPKLGYAYRAVVVAGVLFTSALLLGFSDKLYESGWVLKTFGKFPYGKVLVDTYDAVHAYCSRLSVVVKAVLLSMVLQISSVIFFVLIGNAMGVTMSFGSYMFIVPLGFVAASLPITPGGIGIGQAAFFALFNAYLGKPSPLGPNSITLYQIMCFVFGLVGGFMYLTRKRYESNH